MGISVITSARSANQKMEEEFDGPTKHTIQKVDDLLDKSGLSADAQTDIRARFMSRLEVFYNYTPDQQLEFVTDEIDSALAETRRAKHEAAKATKRKIRREAKKRRPKHVEVRQHRKGRMTPTDPTKDDENDDGSIAA